MLRTIFILTTTALLFMTNGTQAQDEPRLSYMLHPGERYFMETDLQQNTHSESIDNQEISFYNLTRMEFTVTSIDSAGHIHMSVQYKDLLISMLAPQLNVDISSASGKNTMLTEMVDMLEQDSFNMSMTPAGKLVSLHGLDKMFAHLASFPAKDSSEQEVILKTLEEAYGSDAFHSLINLFVYIYPVIQPMSNWTNDISYYFNTKAVNMVNRYYLTKSTDEIVVIQGLGMLNAMKEFEETTGMGEVKSSVSGSQTYDFRMDRESGWVDRCISRQRVMIETTIVKSSYLPSGLRIPSYTETTFEVKGGRLGEAS
jgi:Family of unknown function (DUF6263)